MAKTARRQLGRWHLLFGEYLWSWTNLNVHYRRWTEHRWIDGGKHVLAMFLNYELFWMNNKAINEFGFRKMWRIKQILGGVIHRGRRIANKSKWRCLNFLMGKAFVKINVTIRLFLVSWVYLISSMMLLRQKKKWHLAPALQIYKFCIFELTNKATLVCY